MKYKCIIITIICCMLTVLATHIVEQGTMCNSNFERTIVSDDRLNMECIHNVWELGMVINSSINVYNDEKSSAINTAIADPINYYREDETELYSGYIIRHDYSERIQALLNRYNGLKPCSYNSWPSDMHRLGDGARSISSYLLFNMVYYRHVGEKDNVLRNSLIAIRFGLMLQDLGYITFAKMGIVLEGQAVTILNDIQSGLNYDDRMSVISALHSVSSNRPSWKDLLDADYMSCMNYMHKRLMSENRGAYRDEFGMKLYLYGDNYIYNEIGRYYYSTFNSDSPNYSNHKPASMLINPKLYERKIPLI